MSRKNTIIIAILVNAGLLLVLFMTAMRSSEKKEQASMQLAEAPTPVKEISSTPVTTEELLNEYIAASSPSEQSEVIVLEDLAGGVTPLAVTGSSGSASVSQPQPIVAVPSAVPAEVSSLPAITPKVETPAPMAKKAPEVSSKEEIVEVTVKKGDYLEKIAKAHNTSVNAIMKASHLSSTSLKIGQVLKVPVKGKAASSESSPNMNNEFYIVKEGDSPWLIASKCHVKLDELLRLNNIDEQKAKRLRPGDKLRIR